MSSKNLKRSLAAVAAVAMLAGAVAAPVSTTDIVKAGEVLGETSFEYKALPWHTCESSPAKQTFAIEDGAFHVSIIKADGAEGSKWDLQVRHRNINLYEGHTYKIKFKAKASRNGLQLCSKIGNIKGDEEYVELFKDGTMGAGPDMGGQWGAPMELTTDWTTVEGEFKCTKNLEACEWAFHYANGTANNYGGNAKDGDEIWFDDMSLECTKSDCTQCDADPDEHYGAISRDFITGDTAGKNYISVNQLGYMPQTKKIAVLGDNAGDITHGASKISVSGGESFEVVDAKTGTAVYTGKGSSAIKDDDSGDTVVKLDFSEVTTPGTYYIKSGTSRSFEFEISNDVYSNKSTKLLTNSINYFYQNRSGIDIEGDYITSGDKSTLAHRGGHEKDTASIQKIWKNEYSSKEEATGTYACGTLTANGGWYDAGDHGKYVVNGGISVWTLANMYERSLKTDDKKFADGSGVVVVPETGNKIPDILDECLYELNFMKQMKVDSKNDSVWGKVAEGMIYHKLHDHKWTGLATTPWDYADEWGTVRIVKPPTFAATLNYAANAAQVARLLEPYDSAAAKEWLEEAKAAYAAYKAAYYDADKSQVQHTDLDTKCDAEEINENSLYAPMWQAKGGGPYGDFDVDDDDYWAACEIFITASLFDDSAASEFKTNLEKYKNKYQVTTRVSGGENKSGSLTTMNWGNTASAGSLSLALHTDLLDSADADTVTSTLLKAADDYIATEEKQGYGIPYLFDGEAYNDPNNLDPSIKIKGYEWGSNSMVINNAIVMAYAYDKTGDDKYLSGVTGAMDYLLGTNPLSFSFITGYGSYHAANPHHRYWSHELDKTLPSAPDGVLSGGPNAGLQDPYVRALGFVPGDTSNPSQRCYVDSIEAWSTNEVTINWNSPLAWIASFLDDVAAGNEYKGDKTDVPAATKTPAASESPAVTESKTPAASESPAVTESKTPAASPSASSNPGNKTDDTMLGDVNCDGKVDLTDLSVLSVALVDKKDLSGQSKVNADIDGDGTPSLADLATIRSFLSKVIKTLG